jgi:hypothetical protein
MRRLIIREVVRKHCSWKDGVQYGISQLSMISMVVDMLAKEHSGWVWRQHHLRAKTSHQSNETTPKIERVCNFSVIELKEIEFIDAKEAASASNFLRSLLSEIIGLEAYVYRALLTPRADDETHPSTKGRP